MSFSTREPIRDGQLASPPASPVYEVKPSQVHGLGLFALQRFESGDLIGELQGTWVGAGIYLADDTYVVWFAERGLVGLDVTNEIRYANHCALPNSKLVATSQPRSPNLLGQHQRETGVYLVARRTISPGDEILWDYRDGRSG